MKCCIYLLNAIPKSFLNSPEPSMAGCLECWQISMFMDGQQSNELCTALCRTYCNFERPKKKGISLSCVPECEWGFLAGNSINRLIGMANTSYLYLSFGQGQSRTQWLVLWQKTPSAPHKLVSQLRLTDNAPEYVGGLVICIIPALQHPWLNLEMG